jgi:hypothetical protein
MGVAGWRDGTSLMQVRQRTYLADNATLRAESSLTAYHPGTPEFRLLPASLAVADNIVESREDSGVTVRRAGAFTIDFPETVQTVAVYLKRGDAEGGEALGTLVEVVAESGERLRLVPEHILREGSAEDGEFVLMYRVPRGLRRDVPGRISIRVRASGSERQRLSGVVGYNAPVFQVRRDLRSFELKPQVLAGAEETAGTARVVFSAERSAA